MKPELNFKEGKMENFNFTPTDLNQDLKDFKRANIGDVIAYDIFKVHYVVVEKLDTHLVLYNHFTKQTEQSKPYDFITFVNYLQ